LESCKSKQTYFGIMSWLLGTRLTRVRAQTSLRHSQAGAQPTFSTRAPWTSVHISFGERLMLS
jgi:hypothetical protein